jgi:hypothetical protein
MKTVDKVISSKDGCPYSIPTRVRIGKFMDDSIVTTIYDECDAVTLDEVEARNLLRVLLKCLG